MSPKYLKSLYWISSVVLLLTLIFTINVGFSYILLKVTVTTNEPSYQLREIVNISGNVTFMDDPVEEGLVAIQVKDPLKTIVARTVPAGATPSNSWDVEIVSFIPCDDGGNPKNSFRRGQWANFKVTVKNNDLSFSRRIMVAVNVYDNIMIPLDIAAAEYNLAPGETGTFMPYVWIDAWASTGNSTAYASVYTDLPEDNGYPYCPGKSATFNIVSFEGEVLETGSPEIPTGGADTSSYQASFRLSPEPPPGSYKIHVGAAHLGFHAYNIATFTVNESVPTPPRASFAYWPPQAAPGIEMTFDASSSTAEGYNDTITSYTWDFGDNQSDTSVLVKHTYSTEGNYTVTLNVTDSEGFWNSTSQTVSVTTVRDIAILNIDCLNEVYSDWQVTIKVTIKNEGTMPETFDVTTYYDSSIIETKTITDLGPFSQTTISITWNTAGITPYTNYTLRAEASTVPNETDTSDNSLIFGTIKVKMLGDIDGDRDIDLYDIVIITSIYGVEKSAPSWNPQADLNPDDKINIYDVAVATARYGVTYSG